jgi:hypothetical protein
MIDKQTIGHGNTQIRASGHMNHCEINITWDKALGCHIAPAALAKCRYFRRSARGSLTDYLWPALVNIASIATKQIQLAEESHGRLAIASTLIKKARCQLKRHILLILSAEPKSAKVD